MELNRLVQLTLTPFPTASFISRNKYMLYLRSKTGKKVKLSNDTNAASAWPNLTLPSSESNEPSHRQWEGRRSTASHVTQHTPGGDEQTGTRSGMLAGAHHTDFSAQAPFLGPAGIMPQTHAFCGHWGKLPRVPPFASPALGEHILFSEFVLG